MRPKFSGKDEKSIIGDTLIFKINALETEESTFFYDDMVITVT